MEYLNSVLKGYSQEQIWLVLLGLMVCFQWIAFQVFVMHYVLFQKTLKKRPENVRLQILENIQAMQSEQIEVLFGRFSELQREFVRREPLSKAFENRSASDPSLTQGERHFKNRLKELEVL